MTPQKERESFEKNDCQACDTAAKAVKIGKAAKRIKDAKIPSSKVGKMRVNALKRFNKQLSN